MTRRRSSSIDVYKRQVLDYRAIDSFYDHPRVQGLAEMMNFVGIIAGDDQPVEKIVAAQAHHKKIDGHAPDLVGNEMCIRDRHGGAVGGAG